MTHASALLRMDRQQIAGDPVAGGIKKALVRGALSLGRHLAYTRIKSRSAGQLGVDVETEGVRVLRGWSQIGKATFQHRSARKTLAALETEPPPSPAWKASEEPCFAEGRDPCGTAWRS